jgi:hypothetical protein
MKVKAEMKTCRERHREEDIGWGTPKEERLEKRRYRDTGRIEGMETNGERRVGDSWESGKEGETMGLRRRETGGDDGRVTIGETEWDREKERNRGIDENGVGTQRVKLRGKQKEKRQERQAGRDTVEIQKGREQEREKMREKRIGGKWVERERR